MDRTFKGLTAGIIGAIPMNIVNFVFYGLNLIQIRFIDWSGIILTGERPNDLNSIIHSLIFQMFWSGILGIGLAFLIPAISSRGYFLKAVLYSFFVNFALRGIVVLFRVPLLYKVSTVTSELNSIPTVIWALTAGYMLYFLDKREQHH
ncbi:MAG TPA: hypothetical protein DDW50_20785 [Firmicutes bacterium]|jgi:hypothetical protein|nr:hypothetical protein [Bacillota bacterium]